VPAVAQCGAQLPLSAQDVDGLWLAVRKARAWGDDLVTIRCVSETEIRRLNKMYRGRDASTNVLTFSYEREHDVALCIEVALGEATQRAVDGRSYCALLIIHALLHATGMDHENSSADNRDMQTIQAEILSKLGFTVAKL